MVLDKRLGHGDLKRLGWELEVHEDVVQVDVLPREAALRLCGHVRVGRVPLDEVVLELHHARSHDLHDLFHVDALLRVHHLVVAVREALEDLDILDVQACVVLERLDDGRLRRLCVVGNEWIAIRNHSLLGLENESISESMYAYEPLR